MKFTSYNNPVGFLLYKWGSRDMISKRLCNTQRWILFCIRITEWENNLVILTVFSHFSFAKKVVRLCIFLSQGLPLGCLKAVALPVFCVSFLYFF